jgi:glycosyltransferase involved in cell wall biosynthesis
LKSNNPLVSVVIPTYGRSEMLERAISSVLEQTYDNIEIIIIDDNGLNTQDQKYTEIMLKSYINDEKIVYLKHENNAGGCAARNTGIKASSGEYIGFLDDDDEWLPEFASKHLEKLSNGADVVYCNFFSTEDPLRKEKRKMHTENKTGYVFNDLIAGWCPDTTSMFMINKECFSTSGYFDESLQSFQDYDMWLTLAKNYKFDCCEAYLVVKYQHGFEQLARNPVKRQHALNTLQNKWNKLLDAKELEVFQKTTKKFQKDIYYNELCKLRTNRKYIKSIKKFMDIVKLNNSSLRYIVRVAVIIIFDESFMYKLQKVKAKIVK